MINKFVLILLSAILFHCSSGNDNSNNSSITTNPTIDYSNVDFNNQFGGSSSHPSVGVTTTLDVCYASCSADEKCIGLLFGEKRWSTDETQPDTCWLFKRWGIANSRDARTKTYNCELKADVSSPTTSVGKKLFIKTPRSGSFTHLSPVLTLDVRLEGWSNPLGTWPPAG